MSKITFENKNGEFTVVNRLSYPEAVNERVYNAIASGMFEGFLPVSINQKRKETRLECVVEGLIPLSQYYNCIVNKKFFLDFVHEIALLIKNCEKNMIDANNLELQSDMVFIDPQTQSVKCIFWPVVNNQRGTPPHLFLKQLPFDLSFNPQEQDDYLDIYKSFFYGIAPFSVNNFEKMILHLSGKRIVEAQTTPFDAYAAVPSGNSQLFKKEPVIKNNANIEYDPFAENSGYSGQSFASGQRASSSPVQYGQYNRSICPTLTRLKTGESFSVDKPIFKIGSSRGNCDFLICDNTYISRNHADIVTRNGRYFIVDNNSTNKTFVDGKIIPPHTEVEIFAGTQLRFANEGFIFRT